MSYDSEDLKRIYYRTNGKCHICGKKLSLTNYARVDSKGAWEVEHSVPRSEGGTGHLNNLFAACIACNRLKGTHSSRTARSWNDRTKAPLSKDRKERAKRNNALAGAAVGTVVGLIINPAIALFGLGLGAVIGHSADPEA